MWILQGEMWKIYGGEVDVTSIFIDIELLRWMII